MKEVMHKGLDCAFFSPNTVKELNCKVCGSKMEVKRNKKSADSFNAAIAGKSSNHDFFWCANYQTNWHIQVRELIGEIENSSSSSIRKLLKEEIDLILKNKTPTITDYNK
jgi:hypothetical protein